MGVSTRTRFEIFKRDGFRCAYCGSTPDEAPLHVDHVMATSIGGSDEPSNLITACDGCNLGKSNVPLSERRLKPKYINPEQAIEHAEQIRQYLVAENEVVYARNAILNQLMDHWNRESIRYCTNALVSIFRSALEDFSVADIMEAITITTERVTTSGVLTQTKYFCGILRRWRNERGIRVPGGVG